MTYSHKIFGQKNPIAATTTTRKAEAMTNGFIFYFLGKVNIPKLTTNQKRGI
jgi:hypothetical protein